MADLTMSDVKKVMEFMKELAGIESFVMYYNTEEGMFTYIFSQPDAALMAYSITAAAEKLGKEFAQIALDTAFEIPDEGPIQFIPDSEN